MHMTVILLTLMHSPTFNLLKTGSRALAASLVNPSIQKHLSEDLNLEWHSE